MISMDQSGVTQSSPSLNGLTDFFIGFVQWICMLVIVANFGCSKPEPETPVLTEIRQKAAEPMQLATNVAGQMTIDGEKVSGDAVPEFKAQSRIKLTIEISSLARGVTETAGLIKCVRTVDGRKIVGSSVGLNLPVQDYEFELPRGKGEWELMVVNPQNGLICSQRVSVVE